MRARVNRDFVAGGVDLNVFNEKVGFTFYLCLFKSVKCLFGQCLCRFRKVANCTSAEHPLHFGVGFGSRGDVILARFLHTLAECLD